MTEGGEGVKIIDNYDMGEDDLINVEVEIDNIVNKENKYVVNIISQEFRFEKKINFYNPKEFSGKKDNNDEKKKRIMMKFLIF